VLLAQGVMPDRPTFLYLLPTEPFPALELFPACPQTHSYKHVSHEATKTQRKAQVFYKFVLSFFVSSWLCVRHIILSLPFAASLRLCGSARKLFFIRKGLEKAYKDWRPNVREGVKKCVDKTVRPPHQNPLLSSLPEKGQPLLKAV
jgi:hypothetical protein